MRRILSLTLAIAAPAASLGLALPVLAARRPKSLLSQVTVAPTRLRGGGSDVRVIAKAGQTLDSTVQVKAQASLEGTGVGPVVVLTRKNASTFSGDVRVPVNYDNGTRRGKITVTVVSGGIAAETKQVNLTVLGGGISSPPPPPPIK